MLDLSNFYSDDRNENSDCGGGGNGTHTVGAAMGINGSFGGGTIEQRDMLLCMYFHLSYSYCTRRPQCIGGMLHVKVFSPSNIAHAEHYCMKHSS